MSKRGHVQNTGDRSLMLAAQGTAWAPVKGALRRTPVAPASEARIRSTASSRAASASSSASLASAAAASAALARSSAASVRPSAYNSTEALAHGV